MGKRTALFCDHCGQENADGERNIHTFYVETGWDNQTRVDNYESGRIHRIIDLCPRCMANALKEMFKRSSDEDNLKFVEKWGKKE